MSDRSWWSVALQWAVWGVLMALIMGWLARSRFRARPTSHARRLAHPTSTLIIGVVCFLVFATFAVVSNVVPNESATWWTTLCFVGFALLSAPILLDYFIADHRVSDVGLAYTPLVGKQKYLRWSELRNVRYASTMKWFRLETRSGDVARISAMLMGLPEFAKLLLENAPGAAIESGTLDVLQATAQGNPPSLWS